MRGWRFKARLGLDDLGGAPWAATKSGGRLAMCAAALSHRDPGGDAGRLIESPLMPLSDGGGSVDGLAKAALRGRSAFAGARFLQHGFSGDPSTNLDKKRLGETGTLNPAFAAVSAGDTAPFVRPMILTRRITLHSVLVEFVALQLRSPFGKSCIKFADWD